MSTDEKSVLVTGERAGLVGKLSTQENNPILKKKMADWEKRLERRPENKFEDEVPGPDPAPPEEQVKVRFEHELRKGAAVYLMTGTDGPQRIRCYAQPYFVAGSRENGKLILKPLKVAKPVA